MLDAHVEGDPVGISPIYFATINFPKPSYGVVCVIVGLTVFVELRLVTDGRTDRHTMTAHTALA